eukprot:1080103-Pyramimonas_sp.AAC.1
MNPPQQHQSTPLGGRGKERLNNGVGRRLLARLGNSKDLLSPVTVGAWDKETFHKESRVWKPAEGL